MQAINDIGAMLRGEYENPRFPSENNLLCIEWCDGIQYRQTLEAFKKFQKEINNQIFTDGHLDAIEQVEFRICKIDQIFTTLY